MGRVAFRPGDSEEGRRLEILRQFAGEDALAAAALQRLASLAAQICEVPMAFVSLIDEDRVRFVAAIGLPAPETLRAGWFCGQTILQPDPLIVPDALRDARFAQHKLVGEAGLRFYAGVPLLTSENVAIGAFAVADRVAGNLSAGQQEALLTLGAQAILQWEIRRQDRWLQASQERNRGIVESALDAIVSIDEQGRITEFNPAAERIFGRARVETLGQSMADLLIPERFREAHRRGVARYLETGETRLLGRRIELVALRADGTEFPVELTPARLGCDDPPSFTAFLRDLSERKEAELALRRSEARYRTLFEYAPDGILIAQGDAVFLDANASICRMLGYERDELVGRDASVIVEPSEIVHIAPALLTIKAGAHYRREWLLRRKDGSLFPADVIAIKMPDGNLLGVIRDISERKRSEARFRRLVDSNAQGVLIWKRSGEITEANEAFLRLVGFTREDLKAGSLSWMSLTPPEYAELDRRALDEIDAHGVCAPFEKEYFRRDGTRVPVIVGAACFEDDSNEGVCFVLDVTEQKKLERQSLRAQRLESIGTLAGGIAHDLNNELGPIIVSLELLEQEVQRPEARELVGMVRASAQRGADMVRQILTFARGVEGRRVEVQLSQLMQEVEKMANETFLKHIEVHLEHPPDLWTVVGDPTQLQQVLMNLCVNARDAMPAGGVLTIRAENTSVLASAPGFAGVEPGPYVLLRVEDNGIGMAPEVVDQIFDPFFTTKEFGKGTGLGLSSSLAIVTSHGGLLRVSSVPGQGSIFLVYLPASCALGGPPVVRPAALARGRGELILIVDDEPAMRLVAKRMLEAFGYRALAAGGGVEALALFAERRREIAAVLTDMMMPGMDGPEFIEALRAVDAEVPVIATSGFPVEEQVAEAASLGVQLFLHKPFAAEGLLDALRQVLKEAKS